MKRMNVRVRRSKRSIWKSGKMGEIKQMRTKRLVNLPHMRKMTKRRNMLDMRQT